MDNKQVYNIAFMPYAPIKDGFKLGKYEIWPFYKEAEQKIKDSDVLSQLKKYFGRYYEYKYDLKRGGYDEIIDSIHIISPEDFEIGVYKLTPKQIKDIQTISHIISFSSIFETAFGSTTSDPYIVIIQSFVKGKEGLKTWGKFYAQYDCFKVMKPLYVSSPVFPYDKTKLCEILVDSLNLRDSNPTINKIFRSLELLFYTITYEDMITNEHRLLTLLMAFEVLLNFKDKKGFVKSIEKYIRDININPINIKRKIRCAGNKENEVEKPLTCWWAYDLYDLRSQIIHGETVDWKIRDYGNIWTRIKFSGILFSYLYKLILMDEKIWEYNGVDDFTNLITAYDIDEKLEKIMKKFKEMNLRSS